MFELQSYYEEQKREQMQGPVLKRLEEEQQRQQAQTPPLAPLHSRHWQGPLHGDELQQQAQQPDLSPDNALRDSAQQQSSVLQLHGARSWLGANRQLSQHQSVTQPGFSPGELHPTTGTSVSLGNSNKASRPYLSPKPPLPSRPRSQISSEMSYLGGSAGSSGTGASSDSNT